MKIKIKEKNKGKRLDKFLAEELKEETRNQIQKKIEAGLIFVSGETKKSHYKLKEDDVVEIKKLKKKEEIKQRKEKINLEGKKIKFKLVFENDDFLVIDKPSGLIVHGADHIAEETLVDQLLKKYPDLINIGESEERPGIVHRLDKEASGLMVVVRNQKFFKNLKKQFQDRKVEKIYQALVFGRIGKDEDRITFPIKRSSQGNKQAAVPVNFRGKKRETRKAITEFDVLERFVNYTLLFVKIKTGRKHQIRVHMDAYGHPVVGDPLYHTKKIKELNKKLNLGRMFLVATKLSFKDLKGEKHSFEVRLPKDLGNFLDKLTKK